MRAFCLPFVPVALTHLPALKAQESPGMVGTVHLARKALCRSVQWLMQEKVGPMGSVCPLSGSELSHMGLAPRGPFEGTCLCP